MSQTGHLPIEQQIGRGVNQLNEKMNNLAELVKKVTDKDDAQQIFMQQLASVEEEIRGLRNSAGTRER